MIRYLPAICEPPVNDSDSENDIEYNTDDEYIDDIKGKLEDNMDDVVSNDESTKDILENMDLPYIKEILDNKFNIKKFNLEELILSLKTFSYLIKNSKKVIDRILLLIGSNNLISKYFDDIEYKCVCDYEYNYEYKLYQCDCGYYMSNEPKYISKKLYKIKQDCDIFFKSEFIFIYGKNPIDSHTIKLFSDPIEGIICGSYHNNMSYICHFMKKLDYTQVKNNHIEYIYQELEKHDNLKAMKKLNFKCTSRSLGGVSIKNENLDISNDTVKKIISSTSGGDIR